MDLRTQLAAGIIAASGDVHRWRQHARCVLEDRSTSPEVLREALYALLVCAETTDLMCDHAVTALVAAAGQEP